MEVQTEVIVTRRKGKNIIKFWHNYRQSLYGLIGFVILLLFIVVAVFAPIISPYDPHAMKGEVLLSPSISHPMGTDHLGRDVFSRIVYGTRVSLSVGFIAAGLSAIIGIFIGSFSGYYGGIVDEIVDKIVDTFLMIPAFFLILIIVAIFGNSIFYIMLVIGLTTWPQNARLMRAQALSLRERTFIMVARATGESSIRILFTHIIPNGVYPVLANTALQMGGAILTEAALSFLGLGDPNLVSWGKMIYQARPYMTFAWWTVVFPGIFIVLAVVSFSFIGDGLQYAFNPKLSVKQKEVSA